MRVVSIFPSRPIADAVAVVLCVWLSACQHRAAESHDLLHGRTPVEARFVEHAERLTDGVTPMDGDPWLTDLSAVYEKAQARVVYDLGRPTSIDAIFVQGDNNDRFLFAVSDDGRDYRDLWQAPAVMGAGMRPRSTQGLAAQGRFVRVTAKSGDGYVSIGELLVFATTPTTFPPKLEQQAGVTRFVQAKRWLIFLGVALAFLLLSAWRRLPPWTPIAMTGCAAVASAICAGHLVSLWPPPLEIGERLRAVVAAVASLALLAWSFERMQARLWVVKTVLYLLAFFSVVCFYNFGAPWFFNAEKARLTPVHTYDMRVYFPVAKYFRELRFDGVYFASVKAYLDGEQLPKSAVQHVQLRDLRNNHLVRAREVMDQIDSIKERFSALRWQDFVRDMRFFWRTMGPGQYLGSLSDHGGNATPVWLAIAHLMFDRMSASERSLTLTALLDPLLLLLTFVCILRSFGERAMLLCAIVFGATDFPMFGSDWAGSTLRFDWMAALGLGTCALRTSRYALAGALLAYAGLVRAFPAVAFGFTPLPLVSYFLEHIGRRKPLIRAELRNRALGIGRLLGAGLVTSLLLVGLSSTLFGFGPAWGGWAQKIALHTEDANTNHVGVRTVMAFDPALVSSELQHSVDPWVAWQQAQLATYERHKPAAWALRLAFCLLCVLACRNARPEQAALIGLLLIPVFTYPANYYCHYVFLLPLLAVGQSPRVALSIELTLLLMCVAQYFTLDRLIDIRFFWESIILLTGYAALLIPLALTALRTNAVKTSPA